MTETQELRLSAAIRAGSRLTAQAFGELLRRDGAGRVTHACANGAAVVAALALGVAPTVTFGECFPLLARPVPGRLPCGCRGSKARRTVAGAIDHLNDDHHWSRALIAQWVQSLEDK